MPGKIYIGTAKILDSDLPESLSAAILPHRKSVLKFTRVCALGDIVFSDGVARAAERVGYEELLMEVSPLLCSSAACFANLECALHAGPHPSGCLVGSPAAALGLQRAGVTIANIANNHVYDAGAIGLASTLKALRNAGLTPVGAHEHAETASALVTVDCGGLKVGWLGCARTLQPQDQNGPGFWEFNESDLIDSICVAHQQVDFLFVSIHIGYEFIEVPSPDHRRLAHRCIASGANVVLMHHAHVLQGVERVGERGLICYSLGNFLMDPACGYVPVKTVLEQRRTGAVFVFDFDREGACRASVLPICVDGDFYVHWAVGDLGRKILHRFMAMNAFLDSEQLLCQEFARQRAERTLGPVFTVVWHHFAKGNWALLLGILSRVRPRHLLGLLGMLRIRVSELTRSREVS